MEIFIQARGHAVEICGPETGHVVKPVAYCDTENRAFLLVKRWQSYDALLEALEAADILCKQALPEFDWGNSALSAESITLLNEVPGKISAAIAQATKEE